MSETLMLDKQLIQRSVQHLMDASLKQFYTGHDGSLPRHAVVQWIALHLEVAQ